MNFSFAYPALTPQRAMRTFGDIPGYHRPSLTGLIHGEVEVVGVFWTDAQKEKLREQATKGQQFIEMGPGSRSWRKYI